MKGKGKRSSAIHLFCGLYAALFVVLLGLSGAILAFHDEIDRALNPKLSYVTPQGAARPLAELAATALQRYPGTEVEAIELPERAEFSTVVVLGRKSEHKVFAVAVNQYSGEILGDSDHANNFVDHVRDFHTSLMLGNVGSALMWFSGVGCCALAITGVILWQRRKRLAPSAPGSPTFTLDLHTAVGIYAAIFVFVFGFTAMRVIPAGLILPHEYLRPSPGKVEVPAGASPLSMEQLISLAKQALPGAQPVLISEDPAMKHPAFVAMRYPEDHSERPKAGVILQPFTGAVVHKIDLRSLNPIQKYAWAWNMEIHTGAIFGTPSKVVASASSLVIPLLGLTGPLIWWKRRKQSALSAKPSVKERSVR